MQPLSYHGKILRMAAVLAGAALLAPGRGLSGPAGSEATGPEATIRPARVGGGSDREAVIVDLKSFLSEKETELAGLVAERTKKLSEAENLAKKVEARKERDDLGWFERRAVEKDLARLRTQFEDIERLTVSERETREEAFACAAAIVAELETSLERQLARLHEARAGATVSSETGHEPQTARRQEIDRVMALERDRNLHQRKMNALMPSIQVPAELPRDVPWSKEMIEDQGRAYEANIARLQAERELLVQELNLRRRLAGVLPDSARGSRSASEERIEVQIREYDRKIEIYRDKLDRMPSVSDGSRKAM